MQMSDSKPSARAAGRPGSAVSTLYQRYRFQQQEVYRTLNPIDR